MAATKSKPSKSKRSGKLDVAGALTRKFGPLPAWAYLLIVGGLVYWWRHRASSTGAASSSTTSADTSGGSTAYPGDYGSGSGGGAGAGAPDTTGSTPNVVQLPVDTGVPSSTNNTGGMGSTSTGSGPTSAKQKAAAKVDLTTLDPAIATALKSTAESPVSARNPDFAQAAKNKTAAQAALGETSAFGGVKSVTTKGGVTTTTYGNGRVVQQRKGKSAYVAKAGG